LEMGRSTRVKAVGQLSITVAISDEF